MGDKAIIRSLNDTLRKTGVWGRINLSHGVSALNDTTRRNVFDAIQKINAFDSWNDPYEEHDFETVDVDWETYAFKIDYFDPTLHHHSENPADPSVTVRVMTILMMSEY